MGVLQVPSPGVGRRVVFVFRTPPSQYRCVSTGFLVPRIARSGRGNGWVAANQGGLCQPGLRAKKGPEGQVAAFNTAMVQEAAADTSSDEETDDEEIVSQQSTPKPASGLDDDLVLDSSLKVASKDDAKVLKVKADVDDPSLQLANYKLNPNTLRALESRGITALFPIQKHVFDPAMQGKDLICRAKTGSGKTLAFAIPVIEGLLKEDMETRPMSGRSPRAIVLAPTRELANQVAREFETAASSLKMVCCYGGVPLFNQKRKLRDGVDVVCGTPGRIIDLIQQRAMDLSKIRFVIMDESDQMLDMGFEEDMEQILQHAPQKRQTMLFSATLPQWIKKVARKYLTNHMIVDLVGDEATGRISDTIKPMAIVVDNRSKKAMLGSLLSVHAAASKCIVFTKTKRDADFVASSLTDVLPTEALHGDIPQNQRELTLDRFRKGKFNVLVATDVAARGLDIPNVDLVLHYDMPDSTEAFLHRSGRTGRAGKEGSTIVMVDRNDTRAFSRIVRESHTKIEMIGPPAPREVLQASAKTVLQRMQVVEPEVVKFFQPAAEKVISSGNQAQVLAAAFASMSGFSSVPQHRSLLDNRSGYVTLRCLGKMGRIQDKNVVMQLVRDILGREAALKLERIELIDDYKTQKAGALFDLPVDLAIAFLQNASQQTSNESRGLQFDRPKCLSLDLVVQPGQDMRGGRRGNRNGGGGGWRDRQGDRSSRGGNWGRGGGGDRWGGRRDDGDRWGSRSGGGDRWGSRGGRGGGGGGGGYGRREAWGDRGYSSHAGRRSNSGSSSQRGYRGREKTQWNSQKADWNKEVKREANGKLAWDDDLYIDPKGFGSDSSW